MAKKINFNINLGNKTFYTIIALAIILIVAGVAFAINSGDYSIMGHTCDEIEGGCGGSSLGSCQVIYNHGGAPETTENYVIAVPDFCKNGKGCYISMKCYLSGTPQTYQSTAIYRQDSNGYWTGLGGVYYSNGLIYKNGDSTSSLIIQTTGYNVLSDDKSGTETDANNWVYNNPYGATNGYCSGVEITACPLFG